jgi:hypothetical protein
MSGLTIGLLIAAVIAGLAFWAISKWTAGRGK